MTPEELDEARAKEAWRIYMFHHNKRPKGADEHMVPAEIAARLARENWTPPEPVDPDVLAFREWGVRNSEEKGHRGHAIHYREGYFDRSFDANAYLAGARMAREQERERANHPIAFAVRVMAGVFKDLDHAKREARAALAKYRGEA